MPLEVMLLVLLAAALHAAWNVMVKSGGDPLSNMVMVTTGAAVAGSVGTVFLPFPAPESWPFLTVSIALQLLYFGLTALTYRAGDLSVTYPIMRGTAPAITALTAALILGEHPKTEGWAGILMVSIGVLMLAADAQERRGRHRRWQSIVYALANAAVIVAYSLVDATGARRSGHPFAYTSWLLMFSGYAFFGVSFFLRKATLVAYLWRHRNRALLAGILNIGAYSISLWAMTKAPIASVSALRETSIVFGALLAFFYLKETVSRLRFISIVIVTLGAIAIKAS